MKNSLLGIVIVVLMLSLASLADMVKAITLSNGTQPVQQPPSMPPLAKKTAQSDGSSSSITSSDII